MAVTASEPQGEPPVLRYVSWHDLFPCLLLLRTVKLALRIPILLIATFALLLMPLGWRVSEQLFIRRTVTPEAELASRVQAAGVWPGWQVTTSAPGDWEMYRHLATTAAYRVAHVFVLLTEPFRYVFEWRLRFPYTAYYLLGGLWNLAVWAFAGGIITRIAGVQLARDVRLSLRQGIKHATKHYLSYFTAPLYPLSGVILLALPLGLLGLLLRSNALAVIGSVLWPIALLAGAVMAVLLLGLLFAWPLMWPVVSLEEQGDAFEAVSRSYSYVTQRPLHYLFYAIAAVLLGALGTLFLHYFVALTLDVTQWAASWGAGLPRSQVLFGVPLASSETLNLAQRIFQFWAGLLWTVALAYPFSFFWCAASGIYLLLRRDADETALDEVIIDDKESKFPVTEAAE